jgi:hypothetical protein
LEGAEGWAGVPPANAATTRVRFTGESLHHRNTTVISEEIRSDRQRSDLILVGYDVDGDINFELSYSNFDWAMEAVLCGTWTTNVLNNGVLPKSFCLEKGFLDITKYVSYRGCIINAMTLNIVARRQVTGTIGIMGQKGYPLATSICGTTPPTEPTGNEVMAAGTNIKMFAGGSANIDLNDLAIREITLAINNNGRLRELATTPYTDNFGKGAMEITGTLNAYFADIAHYSEFIAGAIFELVWTISDPSDNTKSYRFTIPRLKITDSNATMPGVDADAMQPITWRALLDAGVGYAIKIERAVTIP